MNELAEGTFQGLHPDEVVLFQKVLKGVKGIGVEIGCLDGFSSRVILEASELHLTSIDPFIPDSMEASLVGDEQRYFENVAAFMGEANRAQLAIEYSHNYFRQWDEFIREEIDFLFIDGDHTYDMVLGDLESWSKWLKPGGIVAMHDARMGREGGATFHPGPSRVAQERIFSRPDEWTIVGEAYSLVIARKR